MSFKEMIEKTTECTYFEGKIPVNYIYTLGVAGEAFYKNLKEKGTFIASKCSACGQLYIPAIIFCDECFEECKEYVDIGTEGELYSYSESNFDFKGNKYDTPHLMGIIRFPNVKGGIIAKLDIPKKNLKLGMKVQAQLKPQGDRIGLITDIECFK
jgi:uncharacterized protein